MRSQAFALGSLLVIVASLVGGCTSRMSAAAATSIDPNQALVTALRRHVKHIFIIYQENHSFDEYFGTYPGAENLSTALARSHGFRQYDPIGKQWVTPFLITDPDLDSPGHSRPALLAKMNGGSADQYVARQEKDSVKDGHNAADAQAIGLMSMSHYDCNTIPFLWKYASSFDLFDHIFQGMTGPSTPGNIEIIAAQSGQTQWARDPGEVVAKNGKGPGEPIESSIEAPFGPYDGAPAKPMAIDQHYATVLLTLTGHDDRLVTNDIDGVRSDLAFITNSGRPAINWGWYQEGYNGANNPALRGYESHHNAVQYFGYAHNNSVLWNNVHDVKAIFPALRDGTLPDQSVVYIKGGSYNHFGWRPASKDPFIQKHFLGDDDHPGMDDADRHVAQTFVATFVNAIARSKYWKDSAIIITWDDSGGYYDHVPSPQFERCQDGNPCGDGPRVPFILISPYAKSGAIVHDQGDTGSVVKFIETVFGLPALASLPDEKPYMPEGPRDANPRLTDLTGGFDVRRLAGTVAPIPASAAEIKDTVVNTFPPSMNCATLGISPVKPLGESSSPPQGYLPRPLVYLP